MEERGEEITADALLLPHNRQISFIFNDSLYFIGRYHLLSFLLREHLITVQDICTSGHRDRGSGELAGTWQKEQGESKIGQTPGASHQVLLNSFFFSF